MSTSQPRQLIFTWSRYPELDKPGYEVSSQGDKTFSALYAKVGGRTIEARYQLEVKGFNRITSDWREGKGKPALNGKSREQLWEDYLRLWRHWAGTHMHDMHFLRTMAHQRGCHLTDAFATSDINQAHALSTLLTEMTLTEITR